MLEKVRIISIRFLNFKNVPYGSVNVGSRDYFKDSGRYGEVYGIYGPNGSGKSALIEVCDLAREVIVNGLPEDASRFVMYGENKSWFKIQFLVEKEDGTFLVIYSVAFGYPDKGSRETFGILEEEIQFKKWNEDSGEFSMVQTLERYLSPESDSRKSRISIFAKKTRTLLETAAAADRSASYFFSKFSFNLISQVKYDGKSASKKEKLYLLQQLLPALKSYCQNQWLIVKHPSAHDTPFLKTAIGFLIQQEGLEEKKLLSLCSFSWQTGTIQVPRKLAGYAGMAAAQMNLALQEIIPGLKLELANAHQTVLPDGEQLTDFEVICRQDYRWDDRQIPLRYESNGIKRIVTLLEFLIPVVNSKYVCLMIDDLDSGIFEYLLGEIIETLSETVKGQLLFTAQNFRILEKLSSKEIYFTANAPENKYIQLKNVKTTDNLRTAYYRTLILSTDSEKYMDPVSPFRIGMAFKKAARL